MCLNLYLCTNSHILVSDERRTFVMIFLVPQIRVQHTQADGWEPYEEGQLLPQLPATYIQYKVRRDKINLRL